MNQHRIPERLGLINARKWRDNIHGMLNGIPSVPFHKADKYYDSLVSQLAVYERLRDAATLVELLSGNRPCWIYATRRMLIVLVDWSVVPVVVPLSSFHLLFHSSSSMEMRTRMQPWANCPLTIKHNVLLCRCLKWLTMPTRETVPLI